MVAVSHRFGWRRGGAAYVGLLLLGGTALESLALVGRQGSAVVQGCLAVWAVDAGLLEWRTVDVRRPRKAMQRRLYGVDSRLCMSWVVTLAILFLMKCRNPRPSRGVLEKKMSHPPPLLAQAIQKWRQTARLGTSRTQGVEKKTCKTHCHEET